VIDVVVAGAGPAGIATAVAIKRRAPDVSVVVIDRAKFPRSKPCGGGLTVHAEEAMAALGLRLTVPSEPAPRARVRFGAVERDVTLERPVRVVRREEFDASLVAQARELGVEVREGAPLEDFRVGADAVELVAGGQALRAQVLVGADGAGSIVRKFLRGERRTGAPDDPRLVKRRDAPRFARKPGRATPIRLFRLEVPAPAGWPRDLMLYDFSPMADGLRGYLWIFPVPGGRVNVGLMHYPSTPLGGAELTALLDRHLRAYGIALPAPARGWPAWGYEPGAPLAAPRLVTVGDAAGIDALTGEGIAVGLEHGPVAASAITDALARRDFRFNGYRRAIRRAPCGRELALDRWLARLLYRGRWQRWLSLVLFDERMLELYAARVSGSLVLADHKATLFGALGRHWLHPARAKKLEAAINPTRTSESEASAAGPSGARRRRSPAP
jgi:flavin-dependent dehydrogenase